MKKIITTINRNYWQVLTGRVRRLIAEAATANGMHVYLKANGADSKAAFLYFVARNDDESKAFQTMLDREDIMFTRPAALPPPSKICTIPLENLYPVAGGSTTPANNAAEGVDVPAANAEHGRKPTLASIVAWYSPADLLALAADRFVAIHSKDGVKAFDAANAAFGDIEDRLSPMRKERRFEGRVSDLLAAVHLLGVSTADLAFGLSSGKGCEDLTRTFRTWRNRLENLFHLPGYIRDEATNRMSIDAFPYFEFAAAVRAFGQLESNDAIVDVVAVFKEFTAARPFDRKGDDADTAEAFADRAGRCKHCPNILAGGEIETGVCDVCRNSPTPADEERISNQLFPGRRFNYEV